VKTLAAAVAVVLLLAGCASEIGDECGANVDCSSSGDRVCDTTAPGGYCTILDCSPNECPEESVCVAWGEGLSERTYCMRHCGWSGDCRDGYWCFSPSDFGFCMTNCETDAGCRARYGCTANLTGYDPTDWGRIVDVNPRGSKFCTRRP